MKQENTVKKETKDLYEDAYHQDTDENHHTHSKGHIFSLVMDLGLF